MINPKVIMEEHYFIEVDCQQKNHEGERICGDVFLSGRVKEEERIILVLSDGMGGRRPVLQGKTGPASF